MFKKILYGLSLFALVLTFCGCTKTSYFFEINNKDDIKITQTVLVDTKIINKYAPNFDFNKNKVVVKYKEDLTKKGYIIQKYDEDGKTGFNITKEAKMKFFKGEELPDGFVLPQEIAEPFEVIKTPFKTKYSINLRFDPTGLVGMPQKTRAKLAKRTRKNSDAEGDNQAQDNQNQDNVQMQNTLQAQKDLDPRYKLNFEGNKVLNTSADKEAANPTITYEDFINNPDLKPEFELAIKIPRRAKENNANESLGNTYKWVLSSNAPVDIVLKYEKWNLFSIIILFLIIISTFSFVSKNSAYMVKKEDEETKNAF